jgi:hypothetical protein
MIHRHNTEPRENGTPCCTKFETSQKNQPPHEVRQPANSTNQKTIGINKLGTLLSSQTTAATGTKHDQTVMSSLRSNFTSLPPPLPFSKSAGSHLLDPVPAHAGGIITKILWLSADQMTSSARI